MMGAFGLRRSSPHLVHIWTTSGSWTRCEPDKMASDSEGHHLESLLMIHSPFLSLPLRFMTPLSFRSIRILFTEKTGIPVVSDRDFCVDAGSEAMATKIASAREPRYVRTIGILLKVTLNNCPFSENAGGLLPFISHALNMRGMPVPPGGGWESDGKGPEEYPPDLRPRTGFISGTHGSVL